MNRNTDTRTAPRTPARRTARRIATVGAALALAAAPGIAAAPAANAQPFLGSLNLSPEAWVITPGSVESAVQGSATIAADPIGIATGSLDFASHVLGCYLGTVPDPVNNCSV